MTTQIKPSGRETDIWHRSIKDPRRNLGADPETLPASGDPVTNPRLATTDTWKGQDLRGESATEWHRVVLFRRLAEVAGQYLKKVRRSISKAASAPASGRTRMARNATRPKSRPREMKMLGLRPARVSLPPTAATAAGAGLWRRQPAAAGKKSSFDDMDDDIPF